MNKRCVVVGMLGPVLDRGQHADRWENWRPTVSLFQHEDLQIDRLELLYQRQSAALMRVVVDDIHAVSPDTQVRTHETDMQDPWDFEEVFAALHDFSVRHPWDLDNEEYLVHITTGTHVAQICMFLLTEARHFPAKLIQTSPPRRDRQSACGRYRLIDLDLSKYDRLAARFEVTHKEGLAFLKSGIDTHNQRFNATIEQIERVAINSPEPILLTGPTGSGKTQLARRIYELKRARRMVSGDFVEVNSATLRGDQAMSALFGHVKGAFTGAAQSRPGLLCRADGGVLFLDEIGDLAADEQAMLLRALEEKRFLPVGADKEAHSNFQLIAGTHHDLLADVQAGHFRRDLLARISLWTFALPSLRERPEDIAPNMAYELGTYTERSGRRVSFSREAHEKFLRFATSAEAVWTGNFRDLGGAITRMATLAPGGRISVGEVEAEIERLRISWGSGRPAGSEANLLRLIPSERLGDMDHFDRIQLREVLDVCVQARSMAEAGRILFAASRTKKKQPNDADRLRKYLGRFGISWPDVRELATGD